MSKEIILKKFYKKPEKIRQENWIKIYEEISSKCRRIKTILNIGVGQGQAALHWSEFLRDIWSIGYFENLEIDIDICEKAKNSENPLIINTELGDVRKIDEVFSDDSFDLVFWSHGPEHIYREEWEDTFKKIEKVASKVVILQMPWGNGYDYDIGHKAKSIKKGEIEEFGYETYYDGAEDTKNAGITAYKIL